MSLPNDTGNQRPKILAVEDSPTQAEKLRYLLDKNGYEVLLAESGKKALQMLEVELPALVVSDIIMPEMDGYQLCKRIKMDSDKKHIPVILLTSLSKSEDVLEGLECGADYFITKPYDENYLLTSIKQILLERKLYYKDRVRIGTEIMANGKTRLITTDQQQTLSLLISTYEAAVRTNTELLQTQEELRSLNANLEDVVEERTSALREALDVHRRSEERVQHLNMILRSIRSVNKLIVDAKGPVSLVKDVCRIIMDHRGADSAFILLLNEQGEPILYSGNNSQRGDEGRKITALPACCQDAKQHNGIHHVLDHDTYCESCPLALDKARNDDLCILLRHDEEEYGYLVVSMNHFMAMDEENRSLFAEMAADVALAIHNMKQNEAIQEAEKVKLRMEAELRQAQKMEAVGRLAGGVAHDFNNMLGVILGYANMALSDFNPSGNLKEYLLQIEKAAERSADLTRQLLAFSSRQIVKPKVLDLNLNVTDLQKMLIRLIGEDIEFKFTPTEDLWNIFIDPSQVNQILANLTVNARDAITDTGKITIETANVILDEDYCRRFVKATPGEYVLLAFSDNGVGMDAELMSHIFEPFFTTKEEGKGTGLGLATVFGIVKQYDGVIHTYSEPGVGTTFKIYFPRFLGKAETYTEVAEEIPTGGNETILIVEDEKQLLDLAKSVLESCGYLVLTASNPDEACQIAQDYDEEINLLLTDVIMPGMNGKQLQKKIQGIKPGIKTLFMSGYTADAIVQHGVLKKGVFFISKPFTINSLVRKVRQTLETKI